MSTHDDKNGERSTSSRTQGTILVSPPISIGAFKRKSIESRYYGKSVSLQQYGTPREQYGTPREQYGTPREQYGSPRISYGSSSPGSFITGSPNYGLKSVDTFMDYYHKNKSNELDPLSEHLLHRTKQILKGKFQVDNDVCVPFQETVDIGNLFSLNGIEYNTTQVKYFIDKLVKKTKMGNDNYKFNHLDPGYTDCTLMADLFIKSLNRNMYIYDNEYIYTVTEYAIQKEIEKMIGFHEPIFTFADTAIIGTMYALHLARSNKGLTAYDNVKIFVSADANCVINKAVALLGMRRESIIRVNTDRYGRMNKEHLLTLIIRCTKIKGVVPLMIIGTAGTPILGMIDDISSIGDIAKRYSMWYHIDAMWGGSYIFNKKTNELLKGLNMGDSILLNLFQMIKIPDVLPMFICREKDMDLLSSYDISYMYVDEEVHTWRSDIDTSDMYINSRKNREIFKLWFYWKTCGHTFADMVQKNVENSRYFIFKIKDIPEISLIHDRPDLPNVCFTMTPLTLKNADKNTIDSWTRKKWEQLKNSKCIVSIMKKGNSRLFFRLVFCNPDMSYESIDALIRVLSTEN